MMPTYSEISKNLMTKMLQDDVDTMMKWADYLQLELYPDKCVTMSINCKEGRKRIYRINKIGLKQVQNENDIRVTIDHQLNFENYMYEKIKIPNNMMMLFRRSFMPLDKYIFLKLYNALACPLIGCVNSIWYPNKIKDLTAIEWSALCYKIPTITQKTLMMKDSIS